ncbi:MAG: methyltransferase domain-containing protein [Planctomycetota bacterium]|jgi:SAM-dependent methyltransferase
MRLLEIICCPRCKADLQPHAGEGGVACGEGEVLYYTCTGCGLRYPVVDGVVDFLPGGNCEKKRGQKLMESERMVKIYEGKWWRANKFFALFTRISLSDEMSLIKRVADAGPADTVLDLACGPGLYARAFAEESHGRTVIGLDLSWPMLRYGVKKARRLGIKNITFMHGDAHYLPLKALLVDVANCCGALHLFSDYRHVVGELHRVIKPNGRFSMALALVRPTLLSRLKAYLDGKLFGIHYFYEEELEKLLDEAGFEPTVYHAKGLWMIACGVRRP